MNGRQATVEDGENDSANRAYYAANSSPDCLIQAHEEQITIARG